MALPTHLSSHLPCCPRDHLLVLLLQSYRYTFQFLKFVGHNSIFRDYFIRYLDYFELLHGFGEGGSLLAYTDVNFSNLYKTAHNFCILKIAIFEVTSGSQYLILQMQ